MKRSELRQLTPLKRKTALNASPLARSAAHAESAANQRQPKSKRRTPPAIPARIRFALALRSGGMCEVAAPGCSGVATDFSHRKKTGAGGRKGAAKAAHDVLSNALHSCRACHGQQLHAEPTKAYAAGWMLREYLTPSAEPCLYRGSWVWLTDDGQILTSPTCAEEATP
ncbi:hypothetical protein ACWKSP_26245 [Micromonosporaceae bacterium Da 78-11]